MTAATAVMAAVWHMVSVGSLLGLPLNGQTARWWDLRSGRRERQRLEGDYARLGVLVRKEGCGTCEVLMHRALGDGLGGRASH